MGHIRKRDLDSRVEVRSRMWRLPLVAVAACATYRALPLEPPPPGPSALALRYEQTRFHLFTSARDDVQVEAIFASGATIVAAVSRPQDGVFVSTDAGAEWTFTPNDDRFRDVSFDGPIIVGLGARRIHCSNDGGRSWRAWGEIPVDAAAVAGGAVYAAAAGHLYVSQDCAQSWKTLTPQIPAGWRARSIAIDRQSIYISVRTPREVPPLTTLLDGTSEAAVAALAIADGRDPKGSGLDGVWVTHDGGTLWQQSPLAVDAWLAAIKIAPRVEQVRPEAAALDRLEELLGNDRVGVDVLAIHRGDEARVQREGLHEVISMFRRTCGRRRNGRAAPRPRPWPG